MPLKSCNSCPIWILATLTHQSNSIQCVFWAECPHCHQGAGSVFNTGGLNCLAKFRVADSKAVVMMQRRRSFITGLRSLVKLTFISFCT